MSMEPSGSDTLDIALDRDAEVPIGVQLAWALRTRILDGALRPGQRLPALHRLADEIGVNANTIRAVYQRLEHDGLVETRHGSGTYVTGTREHARALTQLVAGAVHAARDAGVDPRDVAAALYVRAEDLAEPDPEAVARRRLRAQIAALEQALSDVLARRPDLAAAVPAAPAEAAPRLLDATELEQQRADLLRRLAAAQAAIDAEPERAPAASAEAGAKPTRAPAPGAKLRLTPRVT
jgi:GntR family transcriptional regulator